MKHSIFRGSADGVIVFVNDRSSMTNRYWGPTAVGKGVGRYSLKDLKQFYYHRCQDLRKHEDTNYGEDQI
jgi:hypothetical protein